MALSTSGAPVYGGGTLDVEFTEETELSTERCYYVLYEGSKQRHLTTAKLLTSHKLQSVIPGHTIVEEVKLTVVEFHDEKSTNLVTSAFTFNSDSALYLSQFLIDSVISSDSLDDLELIKGDNFNVADEELSSLDNRLSRALTYGSFPDWWSLLGSDSENDTPPPRESLLHFTARLGLAKVATFLLRKPGSKQCLKLHNKNGQLPKDVAIENGYDGLAELLSEYNIHSLMPVGRWLVTDEGVIQTQDTGDVTLTSNIDTHKRTIGEDIIVLQGVQKQLENEDHSISRQWQTDWPADHYNSDTKVNDEDTADQKFKTICEKVQELPNVLTLETINDYRDSNDTYTDPNIDDNHGNDNVDMNEDSDVAMETETLPKLHVSEGEEDDEGIMDLKVDYLKRKYTKKGTLSALRGYNEHLLRIRQKSTVFNKILEQELRKENLARFSSSCPSLDVDCRNSPLPVIDEADLCKSMVDLAEDNVGETAATPSSLYTSGEVFSSGPDITNSTDNIHIVVDGATTGSSSDFGLQTREYDQFLKDYYGGNNPQVRHRSPVPTKRDTIENGDSQEMLIHGNKSVVLPQSEDIENTLCNEEDMNDGLLNAGSEGTRRGGVRSTGDMEHEARDNEKGYENSMQGRGSANKARYSADIEHLMRNLKGHHSGSSLDKMSSSTHSTSSSTDNEALGVMPHGKITKAFSMSSIPAATANDKQKGPSYKDKQTPSHLLIQNLIAEHDAQFRRQDEIREEDSADVLYENNQNNRRQKSKPELSLLDFLNDPSNFSNDSSNLSSPKPKDKEDKKRKPSMFSRFHSSYRIKKNKDKEGKSKSSSHRFVSVSFSNATTCDVCHKLLTNKPALRCQICLVNVHEHSCKEHIPACDKNKSKRLARSHPGSAEPSPGLPQRSPRSNPGSAEPSPRPPQKSQRRNTIDNSPSYDYPPASPRKHEFHQSQVPRQSSTESEAVPGSQDRSNASTGVPNLRPSHSFKDNTTRAQSMYIGAASQPMPSAIVPDIQQDSIIMRKRRSALQSASAQLQRRSLPTPRIVIDTTHVQDRPKSPNPIATISSSASESAVASSADGKNNNHPIAEDDREQDNVSRLDLGQSNITETMSHSIESLDEVDSVQEVRYDDVELGSLDVDEPETWSETVDKKVLKKMNPKDIKRQDTIWELIQTERHYCKRLKTLQIFYRDGMLRELGVTRRLVDNLFPQLDDLIFVHMNFYHQLQDLQNRRPDRLVEEIGPALKEQFSGDSANRMKASYGVFCSGHLESVQLYKDLMEKKKFQLFIRSRSQHPLCKKREIPDFILLITQRPTKYPTLIEAVIKSTKDKKDRECLLKALDLSKDVLQNVDAQVAAAQRAMRIKDICSRLENRSFAIHRSKKFRKSDILANNRVLLHEGMVGWKNARGKTEKVLAVVMNDVLFFLQENNKNYSFFSLDNKHGVVSLFNLLVREKRDTRDTIGMYLISQNKENPEMYEIVFNTMSEMQKWAQILRTAVENCPEEEEEVPSEAEEERRKMEERQARANAIMEKLQKKDEEIKRCCDDKNRLMLDLLAVYNDTEDQQQPNSRPSSRDFEESTAENAGLLQAAIHEVSIAASQLTTMLQSNGTNLSRSVSSVGEHSSNTFTAVPVPKRAETFAGFDNNHESVRGKVKGSDVPDFSVEREQGGQYKEMDSSDPDLSTQYSDLPPSGLANKNYDSEGESGVGSSSSFYSSMSTLSPVATPSQDQSNIAHLLRTLNSIVHLTASQGTAVETLRAQLAEANERINKLSVDVHEKKSGYRHSQLEELRNLQGVIQKEKEDWELKKTRERRDMEQERLQLEEMKRNIDKQEADLKQQKEEFNKKREVLQKQIELLRQSGQLSKDASLSDLEQTDNGSSVQSKADFVPGHRRSASAESFNSNNGETNKNGPSAPKENNFRPEHKSVSKLQSFSFGSKQNLPVHLLSATNEQKIGSKNVQQLPSKLLASGSVSGAPSQTTLSGAKSSSQGVIGHNNSQSTQSLPQEYGIHGQDPSLAHSVSAGQINPGTNQVGTSVTVPKGNWQSNRPKPSSKSGGLSGVLKLAEKNEKKGKGSSSSQMGDKGAQSSPPQNENSSQRPKSGTPGDRNPNINHKSQKSDSDVIYF